MGNSGGSSKGNIRYLDSKGLWDASLEFKKNIEAFDDVTLLVDRITTDLLKEWVGEGRNEFEVQHKLLFGQLTDMQSSLYDLYNAVVESEKTYLNTDNEIRKQIQLSTD